LIPETCIFQQKKMTAASIGECAICLEDNVSCVELLPCKHKVVCARCIIDLNGICPLCRVAYEKFYFPWEEPYDEYMAALFCNSEALYETVKSYILCLQAPASARAVHENIGEIVQQCMPEAEYGMLLRNPEQYYREHSFSDKKRHLMELRNRQRFPGLTVAQTEELLVLLKLKLGGEWKEHAPELIVAMCKTPWLVSTSVGNSGVCYRGNMGEMPNYCKALDVIRKNWTWLLKTYAQVFGNYGE
jgi:hypothetical protein